MRKCDVDYIPESPPTLAYQNRVASYTILWPIVLFPRTKTAYHSICVLICMFTRFIMIVTGENFVTTNEPKPSIALCIVFAFAT